MLAYQFDLGARWFGPEAPSPVSEPARVPPPPGLALPHAGPAVPVARATPARAADPQALRHALHRLVRAKSLGRHVAVDVAQLSDGRVRFRYGAPLVTPASTLKLLTTTAALQVLGPDHRFTTRVVTSRHGRLVTLVGGGDPLLERKPQVDEGTYPVDVSGHSYPARADLQTLARATAQRLRDLGRTKVRLRYDATLFTGPSFNPHWPAHYLGDDVVSRISALWVDEGRVRPGAEDRTPDPARAAADAFAKALAARGIRVVGASKPAAAAPDAQVLASVSSAPLSQIVQHVLEVSDNEGAEVLARQTALATGRPGSFAGGAAAVRATLRGLGVDVADARTFDGSGLSRQDRVRPETLLDVLEVASSERHPRLRGVVEGLPVAGFTGSLSYRFDRTPRVALGRVHAKTGTLTGVNAYAGTVTSRDGVAMVFVVVSDRTPPALTVDARAKLDEIAAALAACTCGSTP
ncbi:MAG: D-alanyl-D-alanine carboxypeptidase/D-alanyl-D-alanine endopeptidase [Nocardioidaceae bacterium]